MDHSLKKDFVWKKQEKLLKLRTDIAKTKAKERVYEEFNVVEEVCDHPRKFTPLPHVWPRGVFDKVSQPLNPDAKPWCPDNLVVYQRSSDVNGVQGPQSTGVEMLEAINKMQLQV